MLIDEIRKIGNNGILQYAFCCDDRSLTCHKIKEWCKNKNITYRLYNSYDIGGATSKTTYANFCSIVFDNENDAIQFTSIINQLIWLNIMGLRDAYNTLLP